MKLTKEQQERQREAQRDYDLTEQKMMGHALAGGAKPEHVGSVLDHYAGKLTDAVSGGRVTQKQIDDPEFHRRVVANVVKQNPHVHVSHVPPAPPEQREERSEVVGKATVPKPPKGRTFAPGKKNSVSKEEAHARMRAVNNGRMPY